MAFATDADVEDRLGRSLTEAESLVVDTRLFDAELLIFGYCGEQFESDSEHGPTLIAVEADMVARSFKQDASGQEPGVDALQLGAFSTHFVSASQGGNVWLSAADKLRLRFCRRGVTAVRLHGPRYTATEDS